MYWGCLGKFPHHLLTCWCAFKDFLDLTSRVGERAFGRQICPGSAMLQRLVTALENSELADFGWILLHRCELTWIPKMMFWKMYLLSEYRLFFGGVFASVLSHLLLPWGLWVVLYSIMGDIRGTQAAVSIDSIVGVLGKEGYDHVAGGALFCYTESKHFDPPAIESTLHLYNSPKHCLFLFVL